MAEIESLFFDLGGVLYSLDYQSVWSGFRRRCGRPVKDIQEVLYAEDIFYGYESGKITSGEYYRAVTERLCCEMSFDEFKHIWNSLLVKQESMFQIALGVRTQAEVVIISNTNEVNAGFIEQDVKRITHKIVYSFEAGLLKPDRKIYEQALEVAGSPPEKVLYIDDSQENVDAAAQLGIRSHRFRDKKALIKVFKDCGFEI